MLIIYVYIHLIQTRYTCIVYMLKKTPSQVMDKMLTREELGALKPRERSRYVQNLILHVLSKHQDLSLSEIMDKTNLARSTVSKHVDSLVSSQQVLKRERGMGQIQMNFYKLVGSFDKKEEIQSEKDDSTSYSFFVLENDDDQTICIQQKEEDEFRNSRIKGAIIVDFDDMQSFITYLNTYSNRVIQK